MCKAYSRKPEKMCKMHSKKLEKMCFFSFERVLEPKLMFS